MSHGATSPRLPFGASLHHREESAAAPALGALYMPAIVVVTLGAFALRLVMLDRFPFREDEATYAYWALHGWLEDPLFLEVWPDKPPLFLWLLGGAFRLFGVSEASARWVNIAASTLTVPVVAATARRLWSPSAAVAAAAVLALSPYAVSFGPTAYTDPVLVLAGMLAFCLAVYGRALGAGLLLGAAVMTKQQGLLYVPLVAGGLWLAPSTMAARHRALLRRVAALAVGVALVALPVLYWDSLRWAVAPSPWDLSMRNYAALALLRPAAWPARAVEWAPLLADLAASWAVWAALAAMAVGGALARRPDAANSAAGARREAAILLLAGWSLAFVVLHVATTMQAWDRYLLPLAPMLALAAGWAMNRLGSVLSSQQMAAAGIAGVLLLAGPAQQAAEGRLAVGGDHGDYAGLTDAIRAVQLANEGPFILYHRALGSHYRFYLYGPTHDASGEGRVELRWFPSVVYLVDNAAKMPYPPKYVVEPEWAPLPDLAAHLAMRNLAPVKVGRYGRFTVWEIDARPSPPCDWCVNRTPVAWPVLSGVQAEATGAQP